MRIPDLYIPQRSRYSERFSLFIKPAYRHSLTLQALFAFYWETRKKKSAVDILYNGTSQATRASPRREHPLFVQAERLALQTSLSEAVWLAADEVSRLLSVAFTFLLTNCDVVPTEVEQLYQKTYL